MTRQEITYQGWTNYETWNVNLWLQNTNGSQEFWYAQAREILVKHGPREAVLILARQLETQFDEEADYLIDDRRPCCVIDLLRASLREVNWQEITDHLLEEVVCRELDTTL